MSKTKKTSAGKAKTPAHPTLRTAFCTQNKNTGTQNKISGTGIKEAGKKRKVQSAKCKVEKCKDQSGDAQTASLESQNASLESQIAMLEEQIAKLVASGQGPGAGVQSSKSKGQSGESENTNTLNSELRSCAGGTGTLNSTGHSSLATRHSPLPQVGAPIATPVISDMTAVGSSCIHVTWTPVTDAGGYVVRYSTDETFATNVNTVTVDETLAEVTLNGLQANTTYYVSVKAIGSGVHLDSPFSVAQSAVTGVVPNSETVTHYQSWLDELQTVTQNFFPLLPQLETTELNSRARMRLNGSGVRRYGFIEKTLDVSGEFPQFWPAFGNGREGLQELVSEIEVLRNLLVWARWCARVVQDLLLIAGDDAFRVAGSYYATARDGARRMNPEAQQVFQMLQLFWNRRHRTTDEPTEQEVERDFRALLRGTKDGEIIVRNESDQVVKGEKVVIDNTQRKPRGGVKEVETGEVAGG